MTAARLAHAMAVCFPRHQQEPARNHSVFYTTFTTCTLSLTGTVCGLAPKSNVHYELHALKIAFKKKKADHT